MARPAGEDPILASSRFEAMASLVVWVVASVYTVTYCYLFGYDRPLDSLTFVLGFPDWVFWGIVVPWGICVLLSAWFAFGFIRDVDLGHDPEDADAEEEGHA